MTVEVLEVLGRLAAVVHGGTLSVMAVLLLMRQRLPPLREADVIRTFRASGAVLGVSLGLFILAELATWPGRVNPGVGFPADFAVPVQVEGLRAAVFGVYWVSYIALEIWTLEPCRLLDRDGALTDPARFAYAAASVTRHVGLNAVLFLVVLALGIR